MTILPDCDDVGRAAALKIAADLAPHADDVRIVDLDPLRSDGYDFGDFLAPAVEEADFLERRLQLMELMRAAPSYEPPHPRQVYTVDTHLVRPRRTRWLWQNRLPLGAASLLAGRQGLGKSTLGLWLAAQGSLGELPGDTCGEPFTTLVVSYEDNIESTIVPRSMAAGADLHYVKVVRARTAEGYPDLVSLPGDVDWIANLCREHNARLLLIDPLVAALANDVNSHQDQGVRRALGPLAMLAEEQSLAVLGLMHFKKAPTEDLLMAVGGSGGFTAAARQVLAFGVPHDADPEGPQRALVSIKQNLTEQPPALRCEVHAEAVVTDDGERIPTSKIVMGEECDLHPDDLVVHTVSRDVRTDLDVATDFLEDQLGDRAWHAAGDVLKASGERHISERTLYRAADKLDVQRAKSGFPAVTYWALSPVLPSPPDSP